MACSTEAGCMKISSVSDGVGGSSNWPSSDTAPCDPVKP